MRTRTPAFALLAALTLLPACDRQSETGPPAVRLDDSLCEQCNMIISDERWATATIIEGPRGPEPRLFDDFNCQVNHESEHPDLPVLARWSHCHTTRRWLPTEQAYFLMSHGLRTPMGSHVAAFESRTQAETAREDLNGDVMTFTIAWERLGFAEPDDHTHEKPTEARPQGHHHEP